jgi:hypothetical protein
MSFEHDVMISYAWRDNQPPPLSKQEGWVSAFQEGLEFWLKQLMPRASRIWRDKNQMPGNKLFAEELDQVVGKCAVLLTVMSEPYLSSEWCNRELKTFLLNAEAQGGVRVDNDYRVFKINKLPVERNAIPSELNVITGFDFYEIDPETRMPTPIDPSFGDNERERFIKKVYSVSVALAKLLRQIEDKGIGVQDNSIPPEFKAGNAGSVAEPSGPSSQQAIAIAATGLKIYIPHTTKDLREVRDDLVAELMRRNCTVLPQEQGQFEDVDDFRQTVQQDLAQCDLAIHLIGSRYGIVLDGAAQSVTELQNEWAAAESSKRGMRRLIWMPKELGEVASQQATFIAKLRNDATALAGADLMQDSAEVMKGQVLELLKPKPTESVIASAQGRQIYLLHEEGDKDAVREMRKFFKSATLHGGPVRLVLPTFDGDAAASRELQRQNLLESDAVIVFWQSSSQAWVESSLNEVRKAPASGRIKPFAAKHLVYLAGTKTSTKEDWWLDFQDGLLEEDVFTVQAMDKTPEEALKDYLKTID